jgi:hypothetical protein
VAGLNTGTEPMSPAHESLQGKPPRGLSWVPLSSPTEEGSQTVAAGLAIVRLHGWLTRGAKIRLRLHPLGNRLWAAGGDADCYALRQSKVHLCVLKNVRITHGVVQFAFRD